MQLMDEVAARSGRPGGKGCLVEKFLAEQESWPVPDGRERRPTNREWAEVFDTGALQHKAVHAVMQSYGFMGGRSTVERHRKGDCSCPKN